MSEQQDARVKKYAQFKDLLPLTLALAGLPASEPGKYYTADQIESRAISIKNAYRTAKQVVKEVIEA